MANHLSAIKKNRADQKRRLRNRYQLKTTRTFIKKLKAVQSPEEGVEVYKNVTSLLDKLAKKNIMHRKKVANQKSKLQKFVNALKAEASS